jgi:hypothetical protein
VVSFLQLSPPTAYTHLPSLPYVTHAPSISSFLSSIWVLAFRLSSHKATIALYVCNASRTSAVTSRKRCTGTAPDIKQKVLQKT